MKLELNLGIFSNRAYRHEQLESSYIVRVHTLFGTSVLFVGTQLGTVRWKPVEYSEEYIASMFRVEYSKQCTSVQACGHDVSPKRRLTFSGLNGDIS
jgi:hypothetical protein